MDILIDIIFENPFLLFLIIAGLISAFNRYSTTKESTESKGQEPEQRRKQSSPLKDLTRRLEELAESAEEIDPLKPNRAEIEQQEVETTSKQEPNYSFEREREAQLQRLQEQYRTVREEDETVNKAETSASIHSTETKAKKPLQPTGTKGIDLQSRLNQEGLIESIVMAEILGPPRARKRYHNRYLDR